MWYVIELRREGIIIIERRGAVYDPQNEITEELILNLMWMAGEVDVWSFGFYKYTDLDMCVFVCSIIIGDGVYGFTGLRNGLFCFPFDSIHVFITHSMSP